MSELSREQVKQHIDNLSLCLTYPELDELHALDEADAALRTRLEQVEREKNKWAELAGSFTTSQHKYLGEMETLKAQLATLTEQANELAELKLSLWCPLALSCVLCGNGPLLPEQLAVRWRDSLLGVCFACRDATQQLAAAREQWTKTNAQYESAAKAVTRLTVELDELKYRQQVIADTVGEENWSLRKQLATAQARVNTLEQELSIATRNVIHAVREVGKWEASEREAKAENEKLKQQVKKYERIDFIFEDIKIENDTLDPSQMTELIDWLKHESALGMPSHIYKQVNRLLTLIHTLTARVKELELEVDVVTQQETFYTARLATMEAAMRQAEKSTGFTVNINGEKVKALIFDKATDKLWAEAKRCWGKP